MVVDYTQITRGGIVVKEKWYRLTNRHRWIPVVSTIALMALLWLPTYLLDAHEEGSMVGFYILAAITVLCSLAVGSANGVKLLNPTVHHMHNTCDPYPLLQESDTQLSYVKSKGDRQHIIVNRAAALIALGYNEDALASLEALNIDEPYCVPMWRYCYYANIASAALACGQREKAMVYRQKADQAAATFKNPKEQALVRLTTNDWLTELCLLEGDYQGAATYLSYQAPPENAYQQVIRAYLIGCVEKGFGNLANAKFQLEFVVRYGNRLAVVAKAAALLEEIAAQEGQ